MNTGLNHHVRLRSAFAVFVLAGLAGGLAEVAWVWIYSVFAPVHAEKILRQIVASFSSTLAASSAAPAIGLVIHFILAIALAIGFGLLVWKPIERRAGFVDTMLAAAIALATVWAFNFFVLLPALNPAFVGLLPYPVSLASKLLFGIAMGLTLFFGRTERTTIAGRAAAA